MLEQQAAWYVDSIALEGKVIVDVGANVGALSQVFFDHGGPEARVVSIEPQPENVAVIRGRIQNAEATSWTVEACAASSEDGSVRMRIFDVPYGTNSVVVAAEAASDRMREVPCRRLETLVPDAQVVKVDIEGHEYEVLPRAVPALERVEAWALELHKVDGHPLEDTLALLASHGFALFAAGQQRDDPSRWLSVPIPARLTWDAVPAAKRAHDGVEGVFKMLHVLAQRSPEG